MQREDRPAVLCVRKRIVNPHSAEGLTEKRISSKVRKNAEGRKSVTRSGVSNGKTGSFGNSGRGLPRSRNSRVAGCTRRRTASKCEYRDSHRRNDLEWAWVQQSSVVPGAPVL